MLAFLDESGDPGHKFDRGSSRLFVVGLVTFVDHDEAVACEREIAALRQRLRLSPTFEFHYTHNSDRQKEAFLATVTPFGFGTHVFGLDKQQTPGADTQSKGSLYKWAARTTFENARPYLERATIVIDGSGDRSFRRELEAYLRKRMNEDGMQRIAKIKLQPSHQNDLLQLADYVASIKAGCLNGRPRPVSHHGRFLATHTITRRVWPN